MTDVIRAAFDATDVDGVADERLDGIARREPERRADAPVARQRSVWRRRLGFFGRRPGLVISIAWLMLVAVAAFAPKVLTSRPPLKVETKAKLVSPSWQHLFGTDQLGRDLFSRTVHGSALSLKAALLAVLVGLVIGATLGLLAGFIGGWLDDVIMRIVDVILAIPSLLLSLALITVLGFGVYNVALAVGLAMVATTARIMRSEVLRVRQSVFVEAAHSNGARWSSVLGRHVLPNSISPVLVLAALQFGTAILTVSTLSFLGYGVQPPTPEWGSLVAGGRDFLRNAWWMTTMPGLTVAATVLAGNRIARALDGEGRYGR
jgi:peptide/nickel transport system permease protein